MNRIINIAVTLFVSLAALAPSTASAQSVAAGADETSVLDWAITAVDGFLFLVMGALALVIAVSIMAAVWNALREWSRKMSTLRTVGLERCRLAATYLVKATVMGATASTLFAVIAAAGIFALNASVIG